MQSKILVVGSHTRQIDQQEITTTCAACGKVFTHVQYPGRKIERCPDCKRAHEKTLAAERQKRHRAAKRSSGG